jgi:type VI protein secretion system component VasF
VTTPADEPGAEPGPAVRWLAERTGTPADVLLRTPSALVSAVSEASRDLAGLAVALTSQDPEVRAAAEHQANALRQRFADAPDPADRLRNRVVTALREATERVRDA